MTNKTALGDLYTSNNEFDANVTLSVGNTSVNTVVNSSMVCTKNVAVWDTSGGQKLIFKTNENLTGDRSLTFYMGDADATINAVAGLVSSTSGGPTGGAIVRLSANQTVSAASYTKVAFNTKDVDELGWFDSTTNYRYTPQISGLYVVTLTVAGDATTTDYTISNIRKNGTIVSYGTGEKAGAGSVHVSMATIIVQMNGTTDYLEGWGYTPGTKFYYDAAAGGYTSMHICRLAGSGFGDAGSQPLDIQVFTANGTYTPTSGMTHCIIECVGGGGGGSGVTVTANTDTCGGGGGAGSYSRTLATAAQVGASQTVTIGAKGNGGTAGTNNGAAGGATSVGTLCTTNGGSGGNFNSQAGAAVAAGTGDIAIPGQAGQPGFFMTNVNPDNVTPYGFGGSGADGPYGAGGRAIQQGVGSNASGYGAGGAGGAARTGGSSSAGSNGSAGIVIITEFGNPGSTMDFLPTPQGRLTANSTSPIDDATQATARTTIYYLPYNGNYVPNYDGTTWSSRVIPETGISIALESNASNTGYHQSGKNFDLYLYNDSGQTRLVTGPAWTTDFARAQTMTRVKGIWTNSGSQTVRYGTGTTATLTMTANRGTYLGSFRATAGGSTQFYQGGAASGGTAAVLGIWNCYNRVIAQATVNDIGTQYTYSSATIRAMRASSGNRVSFMSGMPDDVCTFWVIADIQIAAVAGAFLTFGAVIDGTTSIGGRPTSQFNNTADGQLRGCKCFVDENPPVTGWHFISANEQGDGTNTCTISGNGLRFTFPM